jgi:hypothetical protein
MLRKHGIHSTLLTNEEEVHLFTTGPSSTCF